MNVLNQPTLTAFRGSVKVGEHNPRTRAKEFVGDRKRRKNAVDKDASDVVFNSLVE